MSSTWRSGVAFTTIVNSLVNDLLMPPIGLLLGGIDFSVRQGLLKPSTVLKYDHYNH